MHNRRHMMGEYEGPTGMRGRGMFGGLRTFVLNLVYEKPMKGSEIMDEMGKRTMGWWKPSPGSIYPLLSRMEEDGYIVRNQDGRYQITELGKDEVTVRRDVWRNFSPFAAPSSQEDMLQEMDAYTTYFEDLGAEIEPYRARLSKINEKLSRILEKSSKQIHGLRTLFYFEHFYFKNQVLIPPICLKQRDGMRHSTTVLILPVLKITEFSRSVMGELHIIFGIFHPLC